MDFLNRISVKSKLLLITLVVLVSIILVSAVAVLKTVGISSDYQSYASSGDTERSYEIVASSALECMVAVENLYIDSKDEASKDSLLKAMDEMSKAIESNKKVTSKEYETVSQSATEFLSSIHSIYAKSSSGVVATEDLRHSIAIWKGLKEKLEKVKKDIQTDQGIKKSSLDSELQSGPVMLSVLAMAVLLLIFITVYIVKGAILSSLSNLKTALSDLLSGSGDSNQKIKITSQDEVGEIAKILNEYLSKTAEGLEQDAKAIARLNDIAAIASTGIFSFRIKEQASSPQVTQAINAINNMLSSIEDATAKLTKGLIEFASANYQFKVDTIGYAGSIGSLGAGLTALGNSNSELFALITISGEKLESQAQEMTRESEQLSSAANEQAASLEETAAALEEMTGNIQATADKAVAMARSAEEAKKATVSGAMMADQTAKAMVEISEATKSINEAVAIIENIAFQTNILSLNAAVEAATAGEAGKGFAVVAQEVRNLANRSAEAAKEIKALTEMAKSKSDDGLRISDDMNHGFKTIADKIDQTAKMVEDVTSAAKEQMQGISQINDAVTQLDHVTQENAAAATQVSNMSLSVLELAKTLLNAANRTKFDDIKRTMVCDINMIFDTTKLKLDHVNFKENNYAKIKSNTTNFSVTDHHSCNLGKWLEEHKASLSSTSAWGDMGQSHEHVHSKVKEFCDSGISSIQPQILIKLGREIEEDTMRVFANLDHFKSALCAKENQGFVPMPNSDISRIGLSPKIAHMAKPTATIGKPSKDDAWDTF